MKSNDNSFKDINNNNNKNDKSYEKLKLKRKTLKLKYNCQRIITWKINNNKNSEYKSDLEKKQMSSLFSPNINKKQT